MTNERIGNWMLSYKGNQLFPLDLREEDIDIEEIAHSLSNLCRFGGHCREFYSVAQHSVLVSDYCPYPFKLVGLLHDATEAYCGDMVRPLKQSIPQFAAIEAGIWSAIARKFNLPRQLPRIVEIQDARALITEKRDLLCSSSYEWRFPQCQFPDLEPIQPLIIPCDPKTAFNMFMRTYDSLV